MTWDEEMKWVVGTVWTPDDPWYCGNGLYLVVACDRKSEYRDVVVLDLQTGCIKSANYDPYQKPSDPNHKELTYPFEGLGMWTLVLADEVT